MNFLIHINGKNARHIAYIIEHLMEVEAANTLAIRDALLSLPGEIYFKIFIVMLFIFLLGFILDFIENEKFIK